MQARKRFLSLAAFGALALGSLLAHSVPSFAAGGQTGIVRGAIADPGGAPVPSADVTLNGPNGRYTAHSDGRGKFVLIGVLSDTYTLTVRKDGAVRISQPGIGVTGDQTLDLGTIMLPTS